MPALNPIGLGSPSSCVELPKNSLLIVHAQRMVAETIPQGANQSRGLGILGSLLKGDRVLNLRLDLRQLWCAQEGAWPVRSRA